LEQEPGGKIVARWTDNKIPQVVQYDSRLEESPGSSQWCTRLCINGLGS
jgi:hypothetical protein